jgi:hypothetical protein
VSGLLYFTHTVDEHVYGAWYRVLSASEIEVIGVGLLEPANYGGFSPESAAKSVLENFVRQRIVAGVPVPCLDVLPDPVDDEESVPIAAITSSSATAPRESR